MNIVEAAIKVEEKLNSLSAPLKEMGFSVECRILYADKTLQEYTEFTPKCILIFGDIAIGNEDLERDEYCNYSLCVEVKTGLVDEVELEGEINSLEGELEAFKDKLERYESKGMTGRRLFAMVLGIPNVGKSTLINKLSGSKKAKVENRPGVTRDKQWVSTGIGVDLLDMPGILWPKFEDRTVGENLALTGAIKDDIMDIESLAVVYCNRMKKLYPEMFAVRYKLGDPEALADMDDYDLFCLIGKKRGFLISGGEINTERTADMLIDELRAAKLGRITLDRI